MRPDYSGPDLERLVSETDANERVSSPAALNSHTSHFSHHKDDSPPTYPVLPPEALHGLAGDVVRALEPHTESDPVAILVQTLVAFGNAVGRGPHWLAEADRHHANLFTCLVGDTAKGRKGTSWGRVKGLLSSAVDSPWVARIQSGLSSGEGLIWHVRDAIESEDPVKENGRVVGYESVRKDPGVDDKRLFVFEGEFANVLRVLRREGNTLSAVIRNAWDTGTLGTLTKNSPTHATDAHISILTHITRDELLRYLDDTEAGNGFGNRFLWFCVQRSRYLPDGGSPDADALADLTRRIETTFERAKSFSLVQRDQGAARKMWREVYPVLSDGKPGLVGALTARAEAQVMRLSMIYALLDGSMEICTPHLIAALALWQYAEESVEYIFGNVLGDPVADTILAKVRDNADGLSRSEISNLFSRHQRSNQIDRAIALLEKKGKVRRISEPTSGRPTERVVAI